MHNRLTPAPGAEALEVRLLCDRLNTRLAIVAPYGVADFDQIDRLAAEFLLSLVSWEISPDPDIRWAWVLSAENDLAQAWRAAALVHDVDDDGEECKKRMNTELMVVGLVPLLGQWSVWALPARLAVVPQPIAIALSKTSRLAPFFDLNRGG